MYKRFLISLAILATLQLAQAQPTIIEVNGASNRDVAPDKIVLSFQLLSEKPSGEQAIDDIQTKITKVQDVLKKDGRKPDELKTSALQVQFVKGYNGRQDHYRGSVQSKMEMGNDPKAATALVSAIQQATSVNANLMFALKEGSRKAVSEQLVAEAVRDARNKAEILAASAGLKIIGVKSIRYNVTGQPAPMAMMETRMTASPVGVDFPVQDITLSEQVMVQYLAE